MLLGTSCRGGSMNVVSVASVLGSNMYSCGPDAPTHTETMRSRLSNVIDPQSRLIRVENVFGERPRGPVQVYASVCQASLWISDSPLRAMNGFRGVRGT